MNNLLSALYDNLDPAKKLETTVSCNMVEQLRQLIEDGVDLEMIVQTMNGNRALHIAALKGYQECVRMILNAGATPDPQNEFGFTPLAMAFRGGHVECVRLLLSTGCKLYDPSTIWNAQHYSSREPVWISSSADMMTLLILATPDLGMLDPGVCDLFFRNRLSNGRDQDLIKAYCITGNYLSPEQFQQIISNSDEEFGNWVKTFQSVKSLQHYCRVAVRRQLGSNCLHGRHLVPLPQTLQNYLISPTEGFS